MENIKEAFYKVKQDIRELREEVSLLNNLNLESKKRMIDLCEIIENLTIKMNKIDSDRQTNKQTNIQTEKKNIYSNNSFNSTNNLNIKPLNDQIQPISIGNQGVQTDKQTDKQTDRQTQNTLDYAAEMLDSLDNLKKELRLKFKRLTEQELLVFSAIYQISEEIGHSDYKSLSKRLNLSESSIRDYVRRLLNKEIPLEKNKINNKEVKITISSKLKKIASLNTILELRNL